MFWLGLRLALALFLVTRPRAGRVTMLLAGLLLPRPLRTLAKVVLLGKIAARAAQRR